MKKVIIVVLAIVAAFIILKVAWWILGFAFTIAITIFQIVLVTIIAIPIYVILQKKLFGR